MRYPMTHLSPPPSDAHFVIRNNFKFFANCPPLLIFFWHRASRRRNFVSKDILPLHFIIVRGIHNGSANY